MINYLLIYLKINDSISLYYTQLISKEILLTFLKEERKKKLLIRSTNK